MLRFVGQEAAGQDNKEFLNEIKNYLEENITASR
jgi:hypothetical protein